MNVNRVMRIHVLLLSLFVSCCIDARVVTSVNGNELLIQALETINQNIRLPETPREKENLKSAKVSYDRASADLREVSEEYRRMEFLLRQKGNGEEK